MKKLAAIAFVLALGATVTPQASADWRSTKWTMTPDEVLKAENGEIAPTDDRYKYGLYVGQIPFGVIEKKQIGRFVYTVIFNKDAAGKFASVLLKNATDEYGWIKEELISVYGKPDLEEGGNIPVVQWTDRSNGNVIKLSKVMSTVIEYKPLITDGL